MNDDLRAILERTQSQSAWAGFHPAADAESLYHDVEEPESALQEEQQPSSSPSSLPAVETDALIRQMQRSQDGDIMPTPEELGVDLALATEEEPAPLNPEDPFGPTVEVPASTPTSEGQSMDGFTPEAEPFARNQNVIIRDETLRFSAADWFAKTQEKVLILAGVGGIGSWISFLAAKLRPKAIYMYDPDTVELVNMAGQLYGTQDIGKNKVDALADTIRAYTGFGDIFCYPERYTNESLTGDIMICGFDNMDARRTFYECWRNHVERRKAEGHAADCLFIDGRLTAEELQILCIQGDDEYSMGQYESRFLFTDGEAVRETCSFKQTAFMANMIGALVVNLLVNFCANQCDIALPRALPFFTTYQADMMFFNMEK